MRMTVGQLFCGFGGVFYHLLVACLWYLEFVNTCCLNELS